MSHRAHVGSIQQIGNHVVRRSRYSSIAKHEILCVAALITHFSGGMSARAVLVLEDLASHFDLPSTVVDDVVAQVQAISNPG
jgi:hypothetical protein